MYVLTVTLYQKPRVRLLSFRIPLLMISSSGFGIMKNIEVLQLFMCFARFFDTMVEAASRRTPLSVVTTSPTTGTADEAETPKTPNSACVHPLIPSLSVSWLACLASCPWH